MSAWNKLSSGGRDRLARHIIAMEKTSVDIFCAVFFAGSSCRFSSRSSIISKQDAKCSS
jgi:hypothetical protein